MRRDAKREWIAKLEAENSALRVALLPFANAVFNDNGDMTVDHSVATHDDYCNAYFALRATDN